MQTITTYVLPLLCVRAPGARNPSQVHRSALGEGAGPHGISATVDEKLSRIFT